MRRAKELQNLWYRWGDCLLWLFFVLSNALGLILVVRYASLLTWLGPIRKLIVDAVRWLTPLVYVVFLILVALSTRDKRFFSKLSNRLLLVLEAVISVTILFVFFYFSAKDLLLYPNYSFSQYHVYMPSLKFYSYFQIMVLFAGFLGHWVSKFSRWRNVLSLNNLPIFTILLMVFLILFNILSDIPPQLQDELTIYHNYILDNNNKQIPDFPGLRNQLEFISVYTAPNANIIHPTQSDTFPVIGNQPLIRHGLFPRTLVSAKYATEFISQHVNELANTYYLLLLAKDSETGEKIIFPDFKINASEILILYSGGRVERIDNVVYSPEMASKLGNFDIGLIKLK